MVSTWTPIAERDLALCVFLEGKVSLIDWAAISTRIRGMGYTFSLEACKQHFNKMKREFAKAGGGGGGGGASTGTSTPARGKRETPSSRKGSQLKSTKSFAETLDDDDEMPTPSAKRKRTVKEESGGDMGGFAGQNAMQFKSEFRVNGSDSSQPVDLHDSDEYYAYHDTI